MSNRSAAKFIKKKSQRTSVDWDNPRPAFPREVFFDISNACNHTCVFCSNTKISERANMDKALAFRLLDECKANGTTDVGLYATGEPFVRKDLAEFVAYAKKIGIEYVFITTNAALATPERAKPVLDAGVDSIKFSVNAGTRETYKKVHGSDDFDKVIENIKWFHAYREKSGLSYGLYFSMVPTKLSEGEWPILQKLLEPYTDADDLRGCSNQGGNMYENNATEKVDKNNILGSMLPGQKVGKCPDPFFRCTITPQGFMTTCVVDYQNYLCVADLSATTMKEAWHNDRFVRLRERHISGDLKGLICHNCLGNCDEPAAPLVPEFARPFAPEAPDRRRKP